LTLSVNICRAWSVLLVAIVFAGAGVAHAQELAREKGVMDRARPEYDAMGIRLGSFLAYPAADLRFGYDDNVLAEDRNTKKDQLFTLSPSLALESNWSKHSLSIAADSSSVLYTDVTTEDRTDWGVAGEGRLDLLESMDIATSISFQNLTEARDAIDAIQVVLKPTEYDQLDASLAWNSRFNRLLLSLGTGFTKLNYKDSPRIGGGTVDQDFRDREILKGIGELGYEFAAGHHAFVRGVFNERYYRKSPPSVAFNRDSHGFKVVAGWASALSNLIAGEAYVGYLEQKYDSSAFRTVDGVSFGLDLEWYATELTTAWLAASRDVVESTTVGTGGILRSIVAIGLDHELMRNVLLRGEFSYSHGDWKGITRKEDWFATSLGVEYLVNRRVHLDLSYTLKNRATRGTRAGAGRDLDYLRNQVSVGIRFQL
jgi:hypothetical protein